MVTLPLKPRIECSEPEHYKNYLLTTSNLHARGRQLVLDRKIDFEKRTERYGSELAKRETIACFCQTNTAG